MKLATLSAFLVPLAAVLTGCLTGTEDPVDPTSTPIAITVDKNADGSFTFTAPDLPGLDYTWDFGDLKTGKGRVVKHAYDVKNGLMSVVLTAKSADGKVARVGKQHTLGTGVNAAPTASFKVAPMVKVGEAFAVDGSASKDPDGDTLKVSWIAVTASATATPAPEGEGGHGGHLLAAPSATPLAATPAEGEAGHEHSAALPNTGDIAAGASKTLKFEAAGVYQVHCHPHPWMVSKVIVDSMGAKNASVDIVEYSYQDAVVRLAPGGSVTYKNLDKLPHTATVAAFVPKGTVLPLTTTSGNLTISEKGTYDLVLVLEDGKRQIATAKQSITVGDETVSTKFEETFTGKYDQPMVVALAADKGAQRHLFEIAYPGHAIITSNFTEGTPSSGKLQFRLLEETGGEIAAGADISVQLPAGKYFVEAAPTSDSNVVYGLEYAIHALVHLDTSGAPPAHDDGGGHAH